MSSKLVKGPQIDPQQMILGFLAVKYLQEHAASGGIVLTMDQMKALGQFTVRMEVLDPQHPETSPIKCTCISVADAVKMMQETNKMRGVN